MNKLSFINEVYPESKGRIDDKCNLTWNNIVFLLGLFEKKDISKEIILKALDVALQYIDITDDYEEVEINGEMLSHYEIQDIIQNTINNFNIKKK